MHNPHPDASRRIETQGGPNVITKWLPNRPTHEHGCAVDEQHFSVERLSVMFNCETTLFARFIDRGDLVVCHCGSQQRVAESALGDFMRRLLTADLGVEVLEVGLTYAATPDAEANDD